MVFGSLDPSETLKESFFCEFAWFLKDKSTYLDLQQLFQLFRNAQWVTQDADQRLFIILGT